MVLRKIENAIEGGSWFTVQLMGPPGNGAVASERAKRRRLSIRGLDRLKLGEHAIVAKKKRS